MNNERSFSNIMAEAGQRATSKTLSAAAQQVLTILDEDISRVVSIKVTVDDEADTAMTDGIRIVMPEHYAGAELAQRPDIALGLLAHECGHMLQPLEVLNQLVNTNQVPHWLANIAMDIHGEALIQRLFPPFASPLTSMRHEATQSFWRSVLQKFKGATTFKACAAYAALLLKMCSPENLTARMSDVGFLKNLPRQSVTLAEEHRLADFLYRLNDVQNCNAEGLPKMILDIVEDFPDLVDSPPPPQPQSDGGDGEGQQDDPKNDKTEGCGWEQESDAAPELVAGPRVSGELLKALGSLMQIGHTPVMGDDIREVNIRPGPPLPEAEKIARHISERYARPKGAIATIGPERFDRLDAARGLMPFKLDIRHPCTDGVPVHRHVIVYGW
jgi:hypothetical protein